MGKRLGLLRERVAVAPATGLDFTWDTDLRFPAGSEINLIPTITVPLPETVRLPDAFTMRAADIRVDRSGAPDADMYSDAWVDGLLANQGVNHGNESPLQVSDQAVPATQRDGFMKWDLRKFGTLTAPTGGTLVLEIWAGHATAAGVNGHAIFSNKGASDPFTESTITWTNRPAVGSGVIDRSFVSPFVNAGAPPAQILLSLTAAEYGSYLGNWLMVRFTSDALAVTPLNVVSREGATTAQRPRLSLDVRRA